MRKPRLPKKPLTKEDAKEEFQKFAMQIQNLEEDIMYWWQRLGKPLEPIDAFILFVDKTVKTPAEVIERNIEQIRAKQYIVNNYILKYLNGLDSLKKSEN